MSYTLSPPPPNDLSLLIYEIDDNAKLHVDQLACEQVVQ